MLLSCSTAVCRLDGSASGCDERHLRLTDGCRGPGREKGGQRMQLDHGA